MQLKGKKTDHVHLRGAFALYCDHRFGADGKAYH